MPFDGMKVTWVKGISFALTAALLNALVGVLSLSSFNAGLTATQVAFYKCLLAFFMLSLLVILQKKHQVAVKALIKKWHHLTILSFFGFFCLYYFETMSYAYNTVSVVVFTLLASSTLATFMYSHFSATMKMNFKNAVCLTLSLAGLFFFAKQYAFDINLGLCFAALAGAGYGLFLSLNNQFKLPIHGIPLLWWLTLFGVLYLCVPFLIQDPQLPHVSNLPSLIILGIGPTIGGFYCTTRALSFIHATEVQLFELTEPILATLFAYMIYSQSLRRYDLLGAFFILLSILFNAVHLSRKERVDV